MEGTVPLQDTAPVPLGGLETDVNKVLYWTGNRTPESLAIPSLQLSVILPAPMEGTVLDPTHVSVQTHGKETTANMVCHKRVSYFLPPFHISMQLCAEMTIARMEAHVSIPIRTVY